MVGRSLVLAAAIIFAAMPAGTRAQELRHRDHPKRRLIIRDDQPRSVPLRRLPRLSIEPPDRFLPPPIGRRSPLGRDQIPSPGMLSQGFHLTVPMDQPPPSGRSRLDRAFEVGHALAGCWTPPEGLRWRIITVRLSFKRDGSVNGEPRIPFKDAGSAQHNTELANSLLAGLKHCTPLPFSPSLGSAIAGEIFAISFTHQDRR